MFRHEPFGTDAWIVYNDGTLTGDSTSTALVERALEELKGESVCLPPVGPCLLLDRMDPASMLILFINVLGHGEVTDGVEPELDNEIPDGAIA
jgi:hypothetical protein